MLALWTVVCTLVLGVFASDAIIAEYSRVSNASLLWAPYRSNLYFGVRPRNIPHSFMAGLMWYNADTVEGIQDIRHSCEQGDDMAGYGWTSYDPRLGGSQVIRDRKNNVEITTEFVKTSDGNWATRVKGKPRYEGGTTGVVFYAGLEGNGELNLSPVTDLTETGIEGAVKLEGQSIELGNFSIDVTTGPDSNTYPSSHREDINLERPGSNSHYATLNVPDDNVWKAKEIFLTLAQDSVARIAESHAEDMDLPPYALYLMSNDNDEMHGRLHYIHKVFTGPFEFDIIYNSVKAKKIDTSSVTDLITSIGTEVDSKFKAAFEFQAPFDTKEYYDFAKEMYSNLVGGMGYHYGHQLVDRADRGDEDDEEFWEQDVISQVREEGPHELLTLVPSRSFFPRGFYWDEGFHLIPVLDYDADLVLEVVKSWFSQVDSEGWIAREQILGPEARSKVPPEFQVQYPNYANPPTLMLLLSRIVDKVRQQADYGSGDIQDGLPLGSAHLEIPDLLISYIKQVYPDLKSHFDWFRSTQRGDIKEWDREAYSMTEGYRWRGRTPNHCLTSGLDDYPRAFTPHTGELHVDLISWVGMMARAMKDFALASANEEDAEEYSKIEHAITRNIDDLHWVQSEGCYCDLTINTYDESEPVCHKGYISLFPLLLQLIPADKVDERVLPLLQIIRDPEQLWTSFGIRSLSKSDAFYGTKEDYWRGPVWININYMILDSLRHYASESSAVQKAAAPVYKELRQNLVETIFTNWQKTGFAWEQYDAETGQGRGVKHFLGWTSLVVNIMAMPEEI